VKDLMGFPGSGPAGSPGTPGDDAAHPTERIPVGAAGAVAGPDQATQVIDAATLSGAEDTQVIDTGAGDTPPPGAAAGDGSARFGGRPSVLAAIVAGAVLLVLAVVYLVDLVATSGEIDRNTSIAGIDVGGMTPEQAAAALTTEALPAYSQPMTIDVHGEPVTVEPATAGLTADVVATVDAAGVRSANPFTRLTSYFTSTDIPLVVGVDDAALAGFLSTVAADTDLQPVEGAVTVEGVTVQTVEPVIGRTLEVADAATAVSAAWAAGGPGALEGLVVPVTSSSVRATPEAVQTAAAEATAILSAPLVLTGPDTSVEIPVEAIAAVLTIEPDDADGFVVEVDGAALRTPYTAAVEATQTAPADAGVAIVDDKPVITPSVPGRTVDWPSTDQAIDAALRGSHTMPIAYVTTEPSLTTEKVQALGINEVIGEFTTGGFAAASGVNIRVVAEKVNGAIVLPGATFGLNEFTGPRGSEQGYVPAAIIQEGALSTAVGGGISQFATTLYNAAYFAGMGDVTHTPHSFYISRYPPGREATVFDGEIELAFSNDYPTGVLIQTIWTDSDITVRLWGTKQVQVESVTTDRFDFTSPQVIVKPYGQSCSPSGGSSGFSVVNTRIIKDLAGQELRREDFTTVYNGQQNVICSPPPPAPVAPVAPVAPAADPAPAPDPAPPAPAG
jgi:vancomycin resistance protein YoaR